MLPTSLEAASDATPPVINNNSQEEEEQSRGDSSERWGIAQKFTSPMLFSGPEKPRKKSTNPARLTYGKPTGEPGAEKAGRALSDTGLRVTEETLGVKAANTEPALVTRSQGWLGWARASPVRPFPSGLQAAEAVYRDVPRAAGQRERQRQGDGSGHPTGTSPRPFRHRLQGRTVWAPLRSCHGHRTQISLHGQPTPWSPPGSWELRHWSWTPWEGQQSWHHPWSALRLAEM